MSDLQIQHLKVAFLDAKGESFTALQTARIDFPRSAITVLCGPSGSGKSTLLQVIAGLISPQSGDVRWLGETVSTKTETARDRWRLQNIGYVFQDFQLIPELSPLANVALPASFGKNSLPKNRAAELLNTFQVPLSRRRTSELSRGEQQRVAFARALLFDPQIILADEPTASLDAENASLVRHHLENLARAGKTVLVASHDDLLISAANYRLNLDHGQLIEMAKS